MNDMLQYLRDVDINEPVGGCIETYCESQPVIEEIAPVFERFLRSRSLSNRNAALEALVVYGKRSGYATDAVLLHYQSRNGVGSPEEFAAIDYLRRLRSRGSASAARALDLMDAEVYIRRLYGSDVGDLPAP